MERIDQDLSALEQAIDAIATEFRSAYADYLAALGQVVRQQLILATYRLCTQLYPEQFLQLPLLARQELQQALRQLGQQAAQLLLLPMQPAEAVAEDSSATIDAETAPFDLAAEIDAADDEAEDDFSEYLAFDFQPPIDPKQLALWLEAIEQNIGEVLRSTSHAANRLLQQANILPTKLPEPILEAVAKTGMMAEASSETPNLLNLLVEAEEQEPKVTQIVAVRLRLSEIEFGNATLAAARSKLRSLSGRLNQLGRNYQKKQRERAIAEAESAWRSTWFEE